MKTVKRSHVGLVQAPMLSGGDFKIKSNAIGVKTVEFILHGQISPFRLIIDLYGLRNG